MTRPKRALWLINHTTLRQFEVPILRKFGYEVFLPKLFPFDEGNLSASVDFSLDRSLTIPASDLDKLNQHDFYEGISPEIEGLINRHFDIAFFAFFPKQFEALTRHFQGDLVLRGFGLSGTNYTDLTRTELGRFFLQRLERIESRFWFGHAYSHLDGIESGIYRRKAIFLPVGLKNAEVNDEWSGSDRRIFFVCPRIGTSPYYRNQYDKFKQIFKDLPFVVGGAQPVSVRDPRVLGFIPAQQHIRNMRELRVMFYHSTEPNHIHYHPFEAVRAGMPLVFMARGMLDRLGGKDLPGRCKTIMEARKKIERLLTDDRHLIDRIRSSQGKLLDSMKAEACELAWKNSFQRILEDRLIVERKIRAPRSRKPRIAVIVPVSYRGGSLRGAKLLATAIKIGADAAGQELEVVFGHLDDPRCYPRESFDDLPKSIRRRPYRWKLLTNGEAERATAYSLIDGALPDAMYQAPDDGIMQFMDCDLWIIVSDRLEYPILPVRPYILMIYDYLQRYIAFLDDATGLKFIDRAHAAESILVTTEFTRADAHQFAGLPSSKVRKVPMLAPSFSKSQRASPRIDMAPYFIWTTNLGSHKNHENAFKALGLYYEKYKGKLECRITGVETDRLRADSLLKEKSEHLVPLNNLYRSNPVLASKLRVDGEVHDNHYQELLISAAFLWHPARIDNGTFSVVEAAHLRTPALSSDYPAMREIDAQFCLNLAWADPNDPDDMARKLKEMEDNLEEHRSRLPSAKQLERQSVENLAAAYWQAIRDFL